MLTQQAKREVLLRQIEELTPGGLTEVAQFIEFLQFRAQQPARKPVSKRNHPAFGVWADHPEAGDPVSFGMKLRQRLETRRDA
ncbi:MAG: hypothetical protein FD146_2708 [Anaerolineaceae bacterium]|nr:MAG: hypothetical protein FD146_2708 [Anaerolineaceae bacterium]